MSRTAEMNGMALDDAVIRLRDIKSSGGTENWRELNRRVDESHLLIAVERGEGSLQLEGRTFRLQPNAAYLCPPGHTYGLVTNRPEDMKLYMFWFDVYAETESEKDGGKPALEPLTFPFAGEIRCRHGEPFAAPCSAICGLRSSADGLERCRGGLAFQELLYRILHNGQEMPRDAHEAIEAAKAFIDRSYAENITVEQLAHIAEVSPKYFVDLFKKRYGISSMDYLTELRMNHAKRLLAESKYKLREIANRIGYGDEFYFSRQFKRKVGMPPTEYMRRRRRRIAAYGQAVLGQLLPLNVMPYAAPLHPKWTAFYYEQHRADIPVHMSAYRQNQHWESNIETLQRMQPDVIVASDDITAPEKEMLDRLPSVVYVSVKGTGWREQLRRTGSLLGESGEAEQWLANYERKAKEAAHKLRTAMGDETCAVIRISRGQLHLHCNASMAEVFYGDLGVAPAYHAPDSVYDERITLERLAGINPDHLLVMVFQEAETLAFWEDLRYSMAWQDLKAVRNHRVRLIPSDPWREYSASAHERLVRETLALFSGNCP